LDPFLPQVCNDEISLDLVQEEEKQAFLDPEDDDEREEDEYVFLPDDCNIFNIFDDADED